MTVESTHERTARLAYFFSQAGYSGGADEHWYLAERMLTQTNLMCLDVTTTYKDERGEIPVVSERPGVVLIVYDPLYPCIACELPTISPSVSGSALCAWCDGGQTRPGGLTADDRRLRNERAGISERRSTCEGALYFRVFHDDEELLAKLREFRDEGCKIAEVYEVCATNLRARRAARV